MNALGIVKGMVAGPSGSGKVRLARLHFALFFFAKDFISSRTSGRGALRVANRSGGG